MKHRAARAALMDLRMAARHLVLNRLAGSSLVPRPVRSAILRAAGLEVRTLNMFSGTTITGAQLEVGAGTFVNHGCYFDVAGGRITIGARCNIGPQVMVLTATHALDNGSFSRESTFLATEIGDDVWLGARVTVLPGSVIEDRCVVAAGAVVSGRLESGGVYGGVPARRLHALSESETGSAGAQLPDDLGGRADGHAVVR